MSAAWFAQNGWRCRFAWGRRGAWEAATRGDVMVVVDVLSFSSAVATAVHHGGRILPCATVEEAQTATQIFGGKVAVPRQDVPERGRYSLSPITYLDLTPGAVIALPSPNGATCCGYARADSVLFAGCLLNAQAVAEAVAQTMNATERGVTVIACGERWELPSSEEAPLTERAVAGETALDEGTLRFALEDYLGAGAILDALPFLKSPEAEVCAASFANMRGALSRILWECGSGIELREKGYPDDVRHAARWNLYDSAPVLQGKSLRKWEPHPYPKKSA